MPRLTAVFQVIACYCACDCVAAQVGWSTLIFTIIVVVAVFVSIENFKRSTQFANFLLAYVTGSIYILNTHFLFHTHIHRHMHRKYLRTCAVLSAAHSLRDSVQTCLSPN